MPGRKSTDPLQEILNVGRRTAEDLRRLGITEVAQPAGRDPQALYDELSRLTGVRQDPCVRDVFAAAVDFADGKPARPWWEYSRERLAKACRKDQS
jgi:predicted flap endonuclease-1-like 5' DNA nuclease